MRDSGARVCPKHKCTLVADRRGLLDRISESSLALRHNEVVPFAVNVPDRRQLYAHFFGTGVAKNRCPPATSSVKPAAGRSPAEDDTEVIDFSAPPRDDLQTRLHERRLNSSLRLLTRVDLGLSKLGGRAARPGSFASYETGPHMRERASACRDPSSRGPRHPRCGTIPDTSAQRRVISDAGLRLPCAVNHRRPPTFTPQNLPKRM